MRQGTRRSKGCRTCVARRVLCDEARPGCTRCSKSKLQCEGYPDKTIFFVQTSDDFQQASKRPQAPVETRDVLTMLSPCKDDCYVNFLIDRLNISIPGDQYVDWKPISGLFADVTRSGFAWLLTSLKSTDPQSMEYMSSHTLAQAFFGQSHHLPEVTRTAELSYGKILRRLRERLDAGHLRHELDLLQVILTSAVYETIMRDGHDIGWM